MFVIYLKVDNICVYGDSFHTNLVALVVPNPKSVQKLAEELEIISNDRKSKDYYNNEKLVQQVLREFSKFGSESGLNKMEIPTKIKLCVEDWTPNNGLITAALKLKRKNIQNFYQKDIDFMYGKTQNINNNHI